MTVKLSFILSRLKSPGLKTVPVRFRLAAQRKSAVFARYSAFLLQILSVRKVFLTDF